MKDAIGQELFIGSIITLAQGSSAFCFGEKLPVVVAFGNANNVGILKSTYRGEPDITWVKPELCVMINEQVRHFNPELHHASLEAAKPYFRHEPPKKAVKREYYLYAYHGYDNRKGRQKVDTMSFWLCVAEGSNAKELTTSRLELNKQAHNQQAEKFPELNCNYYQAFSRGISYSNYHEGFDHTYSLEPMTQTNLKKLLPNFQEFVNKEITGEALEVLRKNLKELGSRHFE